MWEVTHARYSLSDALPTSPAWPARIRRVPCGVRRPARASHTARQCATRPRLRAGARPDATRRTPRRHVAPRRPQGHRARLSRHAPRRTTALAAGRAQRPTLVRQTPALNRARGPRPQWPTHDARRDPPRAAPQRIRDRITPTCQTARRLARLRGPQRPRQTRRAGRLRPRPAQSRRAPPNRTHRRDARGVGLSWKVRARARRGRGPGRGPRRAPGLPGARAQPRPARASGSKRRRPTV